MQRFTMLSTLRMSRVTLLFPRIMERLCGAQIGSSIALADAALLLNLQSCALQEMYLEARGTYQQAEALILEELEQAPESQMLLKRQVALEKTKGNLAGAIEALRKYVETFQTDREAWEELGHLYLEVRYRIQLGLSHLTVLSTSNQMATYHTVSALKGRSPRAARKGDVRLQLCWCTGADVSSGGHVL